MQNVQFVTLQISEQSTLLHESAQNFPCNYQKWYIVGGVMQESKPLFRPFFILEVEVKTAYSSNRYYLLVHTALLLLQVKAGAIIKDVGIKWDRTKLFHILF